MITHRTGLLHNQQTHQSQIEGAQIMQVGDTRAWERTFTVEDVRRFGQISRDYGIHHVIPDEQGRLMVHGLLTATLPTRIGGELNYLARSMTFDFVRPVFVGDTIRCEVTITQYERDEPNTHVSATFICHNQQGNTVLMGNTSGFIRTPKMMSVGLL
jgi:3-hydroxybutyryl-CoA dehydratase